MPKQAPPPPWAMHTRRLGHSSSTPLKIKGRHQQGVLEDDADAVGDAVAQRPFQRHDVVLWLRVGRTAGRPVPSAALNRGRKRGSSQFWPLTTMSSSAPLRPRTFTALSSSATAASTSCAGSVARPANRSGHFRVMPAISSLTSLRRLDRLRSLPVVREQRGVDGHHLHVGALGVHVRQPFLRRVPYLGRVESGCACRCRR